MNSKKGADAGRREEKNDDVRARLEQAIPEEMEGRERQRRGRDIRQVGGEGNGLCCKEASDARVYVAISGTALG